MAKNLVHFITLSRSDHASVAPVFRAALADKRLDAKLVAGGSLLLKRYGSILQGLGLPVHATVPFLREEDDSPADLARAGARAAAAFAELLASDRPDYVFLLGDRWEMLPVASAASMLGIPIVHHSGGDITQGSADNQTRYALSCLAHLHLVALPEHAARLARMGEEPWRITVTGEPALAELSRHAAAPATSAPFVLATFHPTTFDPLPLPRQVEVFVQALALVQGPLVITAPNPDSDSGLFARALQAFASSRPDTRYVESLGADYHAAMRSASLMIGNSSSGLLEAPSFRLPVVNIGSRQLGRARGDNVIDAPLEVNAIAAAMARAAAPSFRSRLSGDNPYVRADTLELILGALRQPRDRGALLAKRFIDPLHG